MILDFVDFEICIIALIEYRKALTSRWNHLDRLIADRSYTQTCLARSLYKSRKLDEPNLRQAYREIDEQLAEYDNSPSVFYRHELLKLFEQLITNLRQAAREDRDRRNGIRRAA